MNSKKENHPNRNLIAASVLIIIICIYATAAYRRNSIWSTEKTLWNDTAKKSPSKSRAYTYLGIAAAKERNLPEAYKNFHMAIALNPSDIEARFNLAVLFKETNRLNLAEAELLIIIKHMPKLIEPYLILAEIYTTLGRNEESIALLERIKWKRQSSMQIRLKLGESLAMSGRTEEAIEVFKNILGEDPKISAALSGLGNIYLMGTLYGEAARYYKEALAINPNETGTIYNLALAVEGAGHKKEAVSYYERFVTVASATPELKAEYSGAIKQAEERIFMLKRGR